MRRNTLIALLGLLAGWAATLWLAPFNDERVNDFFVYRHLVEPLLDGALPYRDVFLEYPPLAAPAIALPGLAGTDPEAFRAAFAVWTLLLAAATVALTGAAVMLLVTSQQVESVLGGLEWPTLFFFVGLFVMVGALEETGAIGEVADGIASLTDGDTAGPAPASAVERPALVA